MLSYAITDPSTLRFDTLKEDIRRFATKADMILYRDKQNPQYTKDAEIFVKTAKSCDFRKIVLHNDIALAKAMEVDGVHLSSDQIEKTPLAKAMGLFVIISTHTLEEARKAERMGADMITFSPVFATPGKGKPVGLERLEEVIRAVNIPVIALGGILTEEQITACEEAGAKGFASIRYFK